MVNEHKVKALWPMASPMALLFDTCYGLFMSFLQRKLYCLFKWLYHFANIGFVPVLSKWVGMLVFVSILYALS